MPSTRPPVPRRRHVTIPGILRETIQRRMAEFRYTSFSPFALELICFDLRKRREHLITRPFADDTPAVQEALDRELVHHYQPGYERRGLLLRAVFNDTAEIHREPLRGTYSAFRGNITAPEALRPCIEKRWRELGYRNYSAYVTAVIRYDLMLLGPHCYFNGEDKNPEILAALDAGTVQAFHANKPERGYLDYLIEAAAGQQLSWEERSRIMRRIAAKLREMVLKPRQPQAPEWSVPAQQPSG